MLSVELNNIRLHAFHGCLQQEEVCGNDYDIQLKTFLLDASKALWHDELEGTVNYAELYRIVAEEMSVPSHLLEHVAGRICKRIFCEHKGVTRIEISIKKIAPPIANMMGNAIVSFCCKREDIL